MSNTSKLEQLKADLEAYRGYRTQILSTGRVWRLRNGEDSREIENYSLADINNLIWQTERQIDQLEALLNGGCSNGIRVRAR